MSDFAYRLSPTRLAAALLFALAVLVPAAAPRAEDRPALNIAVVDVQEILQKSKAAQAVQSQIKKQQDAYQADIAKQENALRATDQQLNSQRETLSKADFDAKRGALEKQANDLRKTVVARRKELQTSFGGGMNQIEKALLQVVADIAKARGYTLVLNQSMVVLSDKRIDITAEALKNLDAKLPTVTLAKGK